METEATTSERPESRLSSDSDSDSDAPSNKKTEWLATSRAKRATAGNRMKSMLAAEEPDDDLELLFAEDEDDQGFTDAGEDAGDEHMDSSSDDDEENNAGDDMEGEKELEKQAKEKKAAARKRKANDAIPAKFRKKVRIDPTASSATSTPATPTSTAPAPRPKKKSERASWLPSISDMPTRASSRQTTRLSKEQLHAQMEEREAKRLKQLEYMQKKAARLEASKKPPMTQEERLREAEIVEKRNSKSLNRWELAEKQREEERRAKLAALNQRTLKGPVITFWSGTREWNDTNAGKYVIMEEKPKKKRAPKEKATDKADKAEKTAEPTLPADGQPSTESKKVDIKTDGREGTNPKEGAPETTDQPMQDAPPIQPTKDEPAKEPQPEAQADSPMKGAEPPKATAEETKNNSPMKETPPEQPMSDAPSQNEKPVEAVPPLAAEVEKNSPRPAEEKTTEGPEVQVGALGVASPLGPPPPPPASGLAAPISAPESGSAASEPKASSVLAAPMLAPPTEAAPEQAVPSSPSTSSQAKLDVPDPLGAQKSAEGSMPAPAMPNTTNARLLPIPDEAMPSLNEKNPATSVPEPLENQPPAVSLPEASPAGNTAEPPKDQAHGPSQAEDQPAEKTESKTATRNAIVYQNFNENAMKDKNIQTQILFGRKMTRLASKSFSNPLPSALPPLHSVKEKEDKTTNRAMTMSNVPTNHRAVSAARLRNHQPPGPLPRPGDGAPVPQRPRLPRDTPPDPGRVPVEPAPGRLVRRRQLGRQGRPGALPGPDRQGPEAGRRGEAAGAGGRG